VISRIFIDRPILAWVLAISVMLGGVLAIVALPVSQYPSVAPPQVSVTTSYPGADARTVESSVVQVLEQQLRGIRGLLYYASTSSAAGQAQTTVTFKQGTDVEDAQVRVQNRVQQALSRLPTQVQQQGVVVAKTQNDTLLVVGLYDETDKLTNDDLTDYLVTNLRDPISQIDGVGDLEIYGAQYAMRIWLDPHKLNSVQLTPEDVRSAVLAENAQVSAGAIGGLPAGPDQLLTATVTAQQRLQTPEQFAEIILKTRDDGSQVRLGDLARVELGAESYGVNARLNGHPAGGMAVRLAPGANALATVDQIKAVMAQYASKLPPGVTVIYPRDGTSFVRISIQEVVRTLVISVILVLAVMFLFLQDWRGMLVAAVTVPVVLLGTFGALAVLGLTINTMTLFALVLAIGLLVDDAIVVVENVERVMAEQRLSAREATLASIDQISGTLVGIAVVLSAVFLPMAFFGGATGVIYRQFAVTIIAAMMLSMFVALTLTPALCATLLKPAPHQDLARGGFVRRFNAGFETAARSYERGVAGVLAHRARALVVFLAAALLSAVLLVRLPHGFIPEEDQGVIILSVSLPTGASQARTVEAMKTIERYFLTEEKQNVRAMFSISGLNFSGTGQNAGLAYLALTDFDRRKGKNSRAQAIAQRASAALGARVRDAKIFALIPPPVPGLSQAGGFDLQLQALGGLGREQLAAAQDDFLIRARAEPRLTAVRPNSLPEAPQLQVDVDASLAGTLGVHLADANATFSSAWGGSYINDFMDRGRVKRVYMQGDAAYRDNPEDLSSWFVRSGSGEMVPFSAFAQVRWSYGPQQLQRFNGAPSLNIQGQGAPGTSSGEALQVVERIARQLPQGVGFAWSGLAFQEKLSSGQAPMLYGLSILVVFLCLAALYESWVVPLSVLLVIPLGVLGAVVAAAATRLDNDIYFQVGLLTTIGLSAKNAILIVEFAEAGVRSGRSPTAAVLEAARMRLRPILMTSMAFVAGVLPMALARGAGASSQNALGAGVVGGMLTATVLAIYFVPFFYVSIRRTKAHLREDASTAETETNPLRAKASQT
jgi:multidrug efflux pump